MKTLKKIFALLTALVMCVAMAIPGMADVGADGKITIINAMKGQTYEAYLIFTADPSDPSDISKGVSYTATGSQIEVEGFTDIFDVFEDEDGKYTVAKKDGVTDNAVIDFIKTNIDALKQGNAITGEETTNSQIEFTNLTYGYYYITSSLGTVVTVDTAAKEVTVVDKNKAAPGVPDKKITAEDSAINAALDQQSQSLGENDSSVGSVESFQVTFNATNWVQSEGSDPETKTKVTEWDFADSPVGLNIEQDSVRVFVNVGTTAEADITNTISKIAVDSTTGALTFTIPWVDENGNSRYATQTANSEHIPVKVTYNATLTEEAAYRTAVNDVVVKYNDDTELGKATTTTYTYKFKLKKTNEKDAPLNGAEFELYYGTSVGDSAQALTFTLDNDGNYVYDPEGNVTRIAPIGENAEAKIIGLDKASYVLREVVVPTGYNKADDQLVSESSLTKETNNTDQESEVLFAETIIKNQKGTVLPSTGGIGTTIFYIAGGILVIGAIIVLVTRRRMRAEKKDR